jgi:Zn-dependent peptidase ImmA (M78 family)
MKGVSVGGHRYSDPDVLSLINNDGVLADPRLEVRLRAQRLNEKLRSFGGSITDPHERVKILASLAGIKVSAMSGSSRTARGCDALLYRDSGGSRHAVYDRTHSDGRTNFSIAHEIAHTFFPNSSNGVRFRTIQRAQSREANEIERLCDLGASELLMPEEEFLTEVANDFGLHLVPRLASRFGSSYEATVFRLATTFHGFALAGLVQFRYRKSEEQRVDSTQIETIHTCTIDYQPAGT